MSWLHTSIKANNIVMTLLFIAKNVLSYKKRGTPIDFLTLTSVAYPALSLPSSKITSSNNQDPVRLDWSKPSVLVLILPAALFSQFKNIQYFWQALNDFLFSRFTSLSSAIYIVPVVIFTLLWNIPHFTELNTCYRVTFCSFDLVLILFRDKLQNHYDKTR